MNCQERKAEKKPVSVKVGNTTVKIYSSVTVKRGKRYPLFTLAYYEGGTRKRSTFASLQDAKQEANRVASRLDQGERDVLKLTNSDQQTFALASRELKETGVPLLDAVRTFIASAKLLPPGASLLDAAREYATRHPGAMNQKDLGSVLDEFFAAKAQDGVSEVYLRTLRFHLSPLKERFRMPIANITAADLNDWLRSQPHSPRTRKNILGSLVTLFRFAKGLGYLPKTQPTEPEGITAPKAAKGGKIEILTPAELAEILSAADTAEKKVYFAVGAFAGLRAAEMQRLEWKFIDLERGYIEVPAENAKTQRRRLVPICPSLAAWLAPFAGNVGKVFGSQRQAERLVEWAGKLIGRWPKNCLRHSFVSYRVAQTQDVARTALEAGNTPAIVFSNYRELVTPQSAKAWFAVGPAAPENVVPLSLSA